MVIIAGLCQQRQKRETGNANQNISKSKFRYQFKAFDEYRFSAEYGFRDHHWLIKKKYLFRSKYSWKLNYKYSIVYLFVISSKKSYPKFYLFFHIMEITVFRFFRGACFMWEFAILIIVKFSNNFKLGKKIHMIVVFCNFKYSINV